VPPDHPDSNYRMARDALLDAAPLPPDLMAPAAWSALPELRVAPCDLAPLRPHLPLWATGSTVITHDPAPGLPAGLLPYAPVGAYLGLADFCQGTHVTAMPPLPTHTAQILASGMVNGQLVQPDDPASGLPPVVLTGHFQRVADAVERRTYSSGLDFLSASAWAKSRSVKQRCSLGMPSCSITLHPGT